MRESRTWLVPPREGCRLPLNIGFLPLPVDPSQMAMARSLRSTGITPASTLSGRGRRPLKGSPPPAAQTARAVFPQAAFMNGLS